MIPRTRVLVPLVLLAAACAEAVAPDARTPESATPRMIAETGYDIHAPFYLLANQKCGHFATYNGSLASPLDWRVDGVLVAVSVSRINYTNDGSPYTVEIGVQSGGTFTTYHLETFYPQALQDPPTCMQVAEE